jgi:hypothetical protein
MPSETDASSEAVVLIEADGCGSKSKNSVLSMYFAGSIIVSKGTRRFQKLSPVAGSIEDYPVMRLLFPKPRRVAKIDSFVQCRCQIS